MAQTLNYEVQFLKNRDWKIEAAYQDRQAALEVAEDLVHAPGFSKVRVVEETHDDDTGKTETKTVFSGLPANPMRPRRKAPGPMPRTAGNRRHPNVPPAQRTMAGRLKIKATNDSFVILRCSSSPSAESA